MRQLLNFLFDGLAWLLSIFFGSILSGLIWDEMSYQVTKRGVTQRICHFFIALASKQFEDISARNEYIYAAIATIEHQLSERRQLNALKISLGFVWNQLLLYLLLILYCLVFSFSVIKIYQPILNLQSLITLCICLSHFYLIWDMFLRGPYWRCYEKLELNAYKDTKIVRGLGGIIAKAFLQIPLYPHLLLSSLVFLLPEKNQSVDEFLFFVTLPIIVYVIVSVQKSRIKNPI